MITYVSKKWQSFLLKEKINSFKKMSLFICVIFILLIGVGNVSAVSQTVNVDVIDTRDISVYYVPIDDAEFDAGQEQNVDLMFVPGSSWMDKEISVEVEEI